MIDLKNFEDLNSYYRHNPNTTPEELKKTYYKLIKMYHPDLNIDNKDICTRITAIINTQYEEILNEMKVKDTKSNDGNNFQSKKPVKKPSTNSTAKAYSFKEYGKMSDVFTSFFGRKKSKARNDTNKDLTNNPKDIIRSNKEDFMIFKNQKGSYVFISKDYGKKKLDNDKTVNQYKIMYMDLEDSKNPLYIHTIFGNLDFKKLDSNENYRKHIVDSVFTKDKLRDVSQKLYGYIGETIEKEGKLEQKCDIDALTFLKTMSEKSCFKFMDNDLQGFEMKKIYEEFVAQRKLDVYTYKHTSDSKEKVIRTNINMSRMEVNKPYREMVLSKYLSPGWIDKCVKDSNGYIGNPEEEYAKSKTFGNWDLER